MYMEDKNCLTSDGVGTFGGAIAPICLEQDKAYWEVQVTHTGGPEAEEFVLVVGVAKKCDVRQAVGNLTKEGGGSTGGDPLFAVTIPDLKKNDTVGVCFDQSDLPMLVLLVNNELTSHHVTRVRGAVYPFVAFTSGSPDKGSTTTAVSLVFRGGKFRGEMPGKFNVVMAASSLI